ncbi:carboxypeptidase-like regulatory domain-containing protein [Niabella ginsengisoli]|uniref:TonB-dependent receptor n=1 Tax=Niabella ginsengisoli TaxID=522298 RepID=A0ABS9SI04_9BACT|nr:carboxypeptidase-like regulatory domain-containing protein [Niabella ginsengisoli]MCH5597999.1 TonB-dependent receptor [Niabella ginsengisoli]
MGLTSAADNKLTSIDSHGIERLERLYPAADTLIAGIVYNAKEEPLDGATIIVKSTSRSAITNNKGEFSILADEMDTVVISYTGYESKEIAIGQNRILAVTLNTTGENLSDVVVVAYGTQKKEAVVGSVTSVNPEDLKVPSSNLTTALAGRVAGIIAYQRSGEPGADNAEFFIRGVTTFGYKKTH